MNVTPNFCGSCGKKMTAKEKAKAKEADLPFCPKCLPSVVGTIVKTLNGK